MAEDYYKTLGVQRNASEKEIQQAYRKLAREYHPDMNPDDAGAKAKFQRVQQAYDVLGDKKKRDLYDRYGSSYEAFGEGGPQGGPGGGAWSFRTGPGGAQEFDVSDLFGGGGGGGGFADFFSQVAGGQGRGHRTARTRPRRGANLQHRVEIPFVQSVTGGEVALSIKRGGGEQETITFKVPAGIEDGKKIRLRGQGEASPHGGPAGDILITVKVGSHPHFRRNGKNLVVTVPVSVGEAALGGKVDVPTPHGEITLSVPPATSSGKRLRVKGHGIRDGEGSPGDLFAEIQIVLPDSLDAEDQRLLKEFDDRSQVSPRADLKW